MRIQLTEEQYSKLVEQMASVMSNSKNATGKTKGGVDNDDLVDYASASLDVIPGIGNLASFGVDVVHAISYAYRYSKTNNQQQKIEYGIMGLLTLVTAIIPVGGNIINLAAKEGLKPFIRRTPEEILHLIKKLGLYNKKIWPLQKKPWSFNIGLFLFKVTRGEMEEYLVTIYNKLNELIKKVKNTPLEKPIVEFKDMIDDIRGNNEIYGKVIKYV
jgi:hypothetical protein